MKMLNERETGLVVAVACSYLKVLHKKGQHATAQSFAWESGPGVPGKAPGQQQV